jgi:signal peptidase I
MLPALEPGDSVLITRLFYFAHPLRHGDIIAFRYPQDESRVFLKRVIALSGELVEEQGGRFSVNGVPLEQGDASASRNASASTVTGLSSRVPAGRLFVLGDNREASLDSRHWGTVAERNVLGKAFLIYWSSGEDWWDVRWARIGRWLP